MRFRTNPDHHLRANSEGQQGLLCNIVLTECSFLADIHIIATELKLFCNTAPPLIQGGRIGLGTRLLLELDTWLLTTTNIDKCSACQKVVAIYTKCSDRHGERWHITCFNCHFTCFNCYLTRVKCHLTRINCHFTCVKCHFTCVNCHFTRVNCHFTRGNCHFSAVNYHFTRFNCHFTRVTAIFTR